MYGKDFLGKKSIPNQIIIAFYYRLQCIEGIIHRFRSDITAYLVNVLF